ncbi:MAG: hypothetical protein U0936_10325 [Planctomycetaceae bacterium]
MNSNDFDNVRNGVDGQRQLFDTVVKLLETVIGNSRLDGYSQARSE